MKARRRKVLIGMSAFSAGGMVTALTGGAGSGFAKPLMIGASRPEVIFSPLSLMEGVTGRQTLTADRPVAWSIEDDGGTGASISSHGVLSLPAQTFYRDMFIYPFSSGSFWNVPLADGAVYQNFAPNNETDVIRQSNPLPDGGSVNAYAIIGRNAMNVHIGSEDDPVIEWTYRGRPQHLPWPHPEDGTGSYHGGGKFLLRTPSNFQPLTVDGWGILQLADGSYYECYRPTLDRDSKGRLIRVNTSFVARNVLYGTGFPNDPSKPGQHEGIRAPGMSLLGGLIRTSEIAAGRIPHGIAMIISGYQAKAAVGGDTRSQVEWPAYHADNGSLSAYIGVIPMGAMFAIPWSTDIDRIGLTSAEGRMLARAFQEFGGYVVDTSSNAPVGKGGSGTFVLASCQAGMPAKAVEHLHADLAVIRSHLSYVPNNSSAAKAAAVRGAPQPVGGGGVPRIAAPRAPASQNKTNPRKITVQATAGGLSKTVIIPVTVSEVETIAPDIRSVSAVRVPEKVRLFTPLLASKAVTWSIAGGPEAARFEVVNDPVAGSYLQFAGNGVEAGAQSLTVDLLAADAFGNASTQEMAVSVLAGNADGNILLNPSFENGDITDWTSSVDNAVGVVSAMGRKLRITANGTDAQLKARVFQRVGVIPGRTYRLKGAIEQLGLTSTAANVLVAYNPRASSPVAYRTGPGDFEINFVSELPYIHIICLLDAYKTPTSSGYVEWDALKLYDTVETRAPD